MTKKSRFWGNFWGETGRNSGKWVSNKVFGNAGWATPRRHIFGDGSGDEKKIRNRSSSSSRSLSYDTTKSQELIETHRIALEEKELNFKHVNQEKILEMAKKIKFNASDLESICSTLDDLILGATKTNNFMKTTSFNDNIFVHKIKAGIMRLNRLEEYEMAEFYTQQLKSLKKAHFKKRYSEIFGIILLLIVGLFFWLLMFVFI
jgi:hypothetical protein